MAFYQFSHLPHIPSFLGNIFLIAHCFTVFFAHSDPIQTDNCAILISAVNIPPYNTLSRNTPSKETTTNNQKRKKPCLFQDKYVEFW